MIEGLGSLWARVEKLERPYWWQKSTTDDPKERSIDTRAMLSVRLAELQKLSFIESDTEIHLQPKV
jgi:hypothetical protein